MGAVLVESPVRVVLLVLLVASTVVGVAGVATADGGTPAIQSSNESAAEPSIDELSERGTRIAGADPSRRWVGEDGSVYVSYDEVNFVKKLGSQSPKWAVDHVITPGEPVPTDTVTMHFERPRGSGTETVEVVIKTWERQRIVNETTGESRTVATNVSTSTTAVQLSQPVETVEVDIPDADDPAMTTMYLREYPGARWVFERHTTATEDTLPFGDTWSSFLPWFLVRFLAVAAIGVPVAIGGAIRTLDRTDAGPGKGAIWWVLMLGLGGYMGLYAAYGSITELIVSAPYVMSGAVVLVAYVATLEYVDRTKSVRAEELTVDDVQNPLGETVPDIGVEHGTDLRAVFHSDRITFVKSSLRHFLVRLLGAEGPTVDTDEWMTRFEYSGDSKTDEKLYVREPPSVEWPSVSFLGGFRETVREKGEPMSSDPATMSNEEVVTDGGEEIVVEESTRIDTSAVTRALLFAGLGAGAASVVAGTSMTAVAALLGFVVGTAELNDGSVDIRPEAAHASPGKARAITEQNEVVVARTFEELEESMARDQMNTVERAVDMAESYIAEQREQMDRILTGGRMGSGGDQGPNPNEAPAGARDRAGADDD